MNRFVIRTFTTVLAILLAHYLVLSTVHAPLPAEYWLREYLIAKKYQANTITSPKIIFSGGSTTLFGIDASEVQKQLGRPAINLGLHAGMRLEDHLQLARDTAKPGDLVILCLEPAYYDYYTATWTTWDLRNALAWNRPSLQRLSRFQQMLVYIQSSDPTISWDLVQAAFDQRFFPNIVAPRLDALEPEARVVARYLATRGTSREFNFALSNLDANGDILNAKSGEELFAGDTFSLTRPEGISDYARNQLVPFLAEMRSRGVRVIFDYTPYLYFTPPDNMWNSSDTKFRAELAQLGGTMLEKRNALFFPVICFYHSNLHLNEEGRRQHTLKVIEALRNKF